MIGVLGCGRMGAALARALTAAGRPVLLGARRADRAAAVVADLPGAAATDCAGVLRRCRLLVLAVPQQAAAGLLGAAGAPPGRGRTLVDATNPGIGAGHRHGGAPLAAALPHWRTVKALNTVAAGMLGRPVVAGRPVSVPMAGDHPEAKGEAAALVAALGFQPVNVGPIGHAADLEALAVVLHAIGVRHGVGGAVGLQITGLDPGAPPSVGAAGLAAAR